MVADVVLGLARANLALSAAIVLVLGLRRPAQRLFGAEIAYGLWIVPPLAAIASILPARALLFWPMLLSLQTLTDLDTALVDSPDTSSIHWSLALGLWAVGAVAGLAMLAWAQIGFLRRERAGVAGPALVGVIQPRIVVPADYEARFTDEERALIRLHERAHIARFDSRVNALIELARCFNWFNPLVHYAAVCARLDQELACDAAVLRVHPRKRRRYAETLMKAQMAEDAPLGCHWPAPAQHPLERRIRLIVKAQPSRRWKLAGGAVTAGLALGVFYLAWPALPSAAVRSPAPPQGPVILVRAAARILVIPEDRADIAAEVHDGAAGLPRLSLRHVGSILVIEDGLEGRGSPFAARCKASGTGALIRTAGRTVSKAALPVVVARVPLDARVSADGAVFGEVGPSRSLSLFTRGCGDWRVAKAARGLAIYSGGAGSVDAAGLDHGTLKIHRAGAGEVLVRGGASAGADIRSAGPGDVTFDGDADELDAAVSGPGVIRVRQVFGRVSGAVWGSGDIAYSRADGQRFCLSCE